jgi:phosphatidylglycerophosphate synthase
MSEFAGHQKEGKWLFRKLEDNHIRPAFLKLVPRSVETYHLTAMTLIWSGGIVVFSWLAKGNIQWLWGASLMIALQYITDLLDGAVGRMRNTGLVKWGYYMDHFLDYIFFTSILLGYLFIFPSDIRYVFIFLAFTQIGFLINLFLSFGATNSFHISFINFGPTETRLAYVLFNTYLIYFGLALPILVLPYFAYLCVIALCMAVYMTQKRIWLEDMRAKRQRGL